MSQHLLKLGLDMQVILSPGYLCETSLKKIICQQFHPVIFSVSVGAAIANGAVDSYCTTDFIVVSFQLKESKDSALVSWSSEYCL